jgi:hypothetical protein
MISAPSAERSESMLHFTIIMADLVMIACRKSEGWHVTCQDSLTGKTEQGVWTDAQFASVLALMNGVGEEDTPGFDVEKLYEVCEPLFVKWAREVRPIP